MTHWKLLLTNQSFTIWHCSARKSLKHKNKQFSRFMCPTYLINKCFPKQQSSEVGLTFSQSLMQDLCRVFMRDRNWFARPASSSSLASAALAGVKDCCDLRSLISLLAFLYASILFIDQKGVQINVFLGETFLFNFCSLYKFVSVAECQDLQLHKLLGGRPGLLRPHPPLLSPGETKQSLANNNSSHNLASFQAFDFTKLSKENRKQNFELAFQTGEWVSGLSLSFLLLFIFIYFFYFIFFSYSWRLAGIPDFISGDDMDEMIRSGRLDPKVVFAYVQEVYRALKDNWQV